MEFASDAALGAEVKAYSDRLAQFKEVLNKKQSMFMELIHSVEKLIAFNDQHVKNEAEKMQI